MGYRGELKAKFYYEDEASLYNIGDRVAQLIIIPYPEITFVETNNLSSTDRNEGGFGSTN